MNKKNPRYCCSCKYMDGEATYLAPYRSFYCVAIAGNKVPVKMNGTCPKYKQFEEKNETGIYKNS